MAIRQATMPIHGDLRYRECNQVRLQCIDYQRTNYIRIVLVQFPADRRRRCAQSQSGRAPRRWGGFEAGVPPRLRS